MDMVVGNALSWQLILSHMGTSQSQIQNSEKGNSQLSQWTAILCALFFINNIFLLPLPPERKTTFSYSWLLASCTMTFSNYVQGHENKILHRFMSLLSI